MPFYPFRGSNKAVCWIVTVFSSSLGWFLYDLEMKTREQNRNNKRTEIEQFDWFIKPIQMHAALLLFEQTLRWKNFMPEIFLEIIEYFALVSYYNTIDQSNNAFSIKGFLWRENKQAMFWTFHPLADKTNNKHLLKPFCKVVRKSLYQYHKKHELFLDNIIKHTSRWDFSWNRKTHYNLQMK